LTQAAEAVTSSKRGWAFAHWDPELSLTASHNH
jgi:hypothetical protein